MERYTYVYAKYKVEGTKKKFNFRRFMDGIGGYMTLISGTAFVIFLMYKHIF